MDAASVVDTKFVEMYEIASFLFTIQLDNCMYNNNV